MYNISEFTTEADHFKEFGVYTKHPYGTPAYRKYWKEMSNRCINGYNIGRDKISGYNYFYLNFSPIEIAYSKEAKEALKELEDVNSTQNKILDLTVQIRGERKTDFPTFWDTDYNYFNYLEEAEKRGLFGCVLKTRRRGYSYKAGSMLNRNYFLIPKSKSYAFADDTEYLTSDGILTKAWDIMDFIDANTGWAKRRSYKNTDMHKRASYQKNKNGVKIEAGYKSEIIGVTLNNNWNKTRGKAGKLMLFEEAGKFPNLLKSWNIAQSSMQQGRITFGLMVAFGTGGTEGADFMGLEELFYNGKGYDIYVIPNIWDKGAHNSECGFFVSEATNLEGFMDEKGNSDIPKATEALLKLRAKKKKDTSDNEAYIRYIAERPLNPQEATMRISGSIFPINLLKEQLSEIQPNIKKYKSLEWVGKLAVDIDTGEIEWKLDTSVNPIYEYPLKNDKNIEGGIIIYEQPYTESINIPKGVYIAGIDPYDHDESTTDSLGSTWIMNFLTGRLVAEYTGRPSTAKEYYEQVRRLLRYYNAKANYENNVKGILTDFENHKSSYLLADTPRIVADMVDDKRTLSRRKGTPGSEAINKAARESIKSWLLEQAVGKEKGILNVHTIKSIPLLKELIYWNKKINCDRVSALGMLMLYRDDLLRGKLSGDLNSKSNLTGSQKVAQDPYWDKIKPKKPSNVLGNYNKPTNI